MIKGVNKRIIEVRETDSRVFESALLFVSPAYCSCDEARLKKEADRVLQRFGSAMNNEVGKTENLSYKTAPKNKKRYPIVFLSGIVIGVILTLLFKL